MHKVSINVFCPWINEIMTVTLDIDKAKILDIQGELLQRNISYQEMHEFLLIPEGKVRFPDRRGPDDTYASAIRRSLSEAGLTDKDLKCKLSAKRLKGMLSHYHEDYVHFIAVGSHFPCIKIASKETGAVRRVENVSIHSSIADIFRADNVTSSLKVYKPREPAVHPSKNISSMTEEDLEPIPVNAALSRAYLAYVWDCSPTFAHLVVEGASSEEEEEGVSKLINRGQFFKNVTGSPSSESRTLDFAKNQRSPKKTMAIGRPHESPTPASLLDVTLCQFRENLAKISPTSKDIKCFWELQKALTAIFDSEADRREKLVEVLAASEIFPGDMRPGNVPGSDYRTDGSITCLINGLRFVLYVQGVKNEIGTGGADPYYEAIRYYVEYLRPHFAKKLGGLNKLEKVNFPVVLVIHFGPFIGVAGGVFTDRPIVEFFGCIPLHVHTTNEWEIAAGDRFVAALRIATISLSERYPKILEEKRPSYQYPFRDFYEIDKTRQYITYFHVFDDKRIYSAYLQDDVTQRRIVKFTRRYSQEAHTAVTDLAPKLYAANDVYGWFMVVMEDLRVPNKFVTLYDLIHGQREVDKKQITSTLRRLLAKLHKLGYVHGDIRDVNIMVHISDDGKYTLKLVDWDWAGRIGEATYPHNLNPEVRRVEGAEPAGKILPTHDMEMVDLLFGAI